MVMEGDLTLDGEHIIQYTDGTFQNCAPETGIILLSSVTQINSILFLQKNIRKLKIQEKWEKCAIMNVEPFHNDRYFNPPEKYQS